MTEANDSPGNELPKKRPVWSRRVIWWLSLVNLVFVIAFLVLIFGVSERWWLGVIVTYGPRIFGLIPSLILMLLSLFLLDRRSLLVNGAAMLLVAVVAMEFHFPSLSGNEPQDHDHSPYRIVTCNIQKFEPNFPAVLAEIASEKRDLVMFQEAWGSQEDLVAAAFPDWHIVKGGEFQVASRFPARLAGEGRADGLRRITILAVEIDHPDGQLVVFNFHPKTAQIGLKHLYPENQGPGGFNSAIRKIEEHQALRQSENQAARQLVDRIRQGRPVIIAGDFNAPVSSSLFKKEWGDFIDAFSVAGFGYGFTAPCDGPGIMPAGWPWIRIDHILTDDSWTVVRCAVGTGNGSDHRLVSAELLRRPDPDPASTAQ